MVNPTLLSQLGISAAITLGALGMAFRPDIAYEMFKKHKGVCQNPECIGQYMYGRTNSYVGGFHVNMAHYADKHHPGMLDTDKENGTCLCTGCHIVQHIKSGDISYARLIHGGQTIRGYGYIRSLMGNPDPNAPIDLNWDEKPPFEFYQDYAACNYDEERLALCHGMAETLAEERKVKIAKRNSMQADFFNIVDQKPIPFVFISDEDDPMNGEPQI